MRNFVLWTLLVLGGSLLPAQLAAQTNKDSASLSSAVVTDVTESLALVAITGTDADGNKCSRGGTGFAVGDGLFLTARHVVTGACGGLEHGSVRVLLGSGTVDARWVDARVVYVDPAVDVAVVSIGTEVAVTTRTLRTDQLQVQGEPLWVFGYPHLAAMNVGNETSPRITCAGPGRVRAVRSPETSDAVIELSGASVSPGNSGSPVVDSAGRVIGLVSAVFTDTAVPRIIPAWVLARVLARARGANDAAAEEPETLAFWFDHIRVHERKANGKAWDGGAGKPDLYCIVTIDGKEVWRSTVIAKGTHANQDTTIVVPWPPLDRHRVFERLRCAPGATVSIDVYDKDVINDDYVGGVTFNAADGFKLDRGTGQLVYIGVRVGRVYRQQ